MLTIRNFGDFHTFSRASARWRFNSGGVLVQDAANVPSLDYDPITLAVRGLMLEELRTNLLTYSDGTKSQLSVNTGVADAASPLASWLANSIQFVGNTGATAVAYKSYTGVAGQQYAFSSFIKMDDGTAPVVSNSTSSGDFSIVIGNSLAPPAFVQSLGSGVYRIGAIRTEAANGTLNAGVIQYTGQSQKPFRVSGHGLEPASSISSYIASAGAQTTRAADSAAVTDLTKIGFNPIEGTLYAEVLVPAAIATVSAAGIVALHDGSVSNRMVAYFSGGTARVLATIGGTPQSFLVGAAPAAGAVCKLAFAYKANDFAASMNGMAAVPLALSGVPSVNALRLGGTNQGASSEVLNSCLRIWRYIPRRLSNIELQNLTA